MSHVDTAAQPSVCPRCGSADNVHTVQELFAKLDKFQDQAHQARAEAFTRPSPAPTFPDSDPGYYDPDQQIANSLFGVITHLIGKAIGRRARRTFEERIEPALDARADEARRQRDAIIAHHPDLRCCMTDQVLFLAGGNRVEPLSAVRKEITLAWADELVLRLRA